MFNQIIFNFFGDPADEEWMQHTIGGDGLDAKGELDVGAFAELTFAGPFVMEGTQALLNVSSGGVVAFALNQFGKHTCTVHACCW